MDWSNALTVIGLFIVTLTAIGAGLALIRGSYSKARIEALRGDNEDLRSKVHDLREEVNDLEHGRETDRLEKEALSERVSHVENENDLLKRLVTQRAEVDLVKTTLEDHHGKAMTGIDEIKELLNEIVSQLEGQQASGG